MRSLVSTTHCLLSIAKLMSGKLPKKQFSAIQVIPVIRQVTREKKPSATRYQFDVPPNPLAKKADTN